MTWCFWRRRGLICENCGDDNWQTIKFWTYDKDKKGRVNKKIFVCMTYYCGEQRNALTGERIPI